MPPDPTEPSPTGPARPNRPMRDTSAALLTLSGLAAAFGVASCCGLPFLLATAGFSTAWLGGVALLAAPHRPLLLTLAALCLIAGAGLLWRRQPAGICATGSLCSKPLTRGLTTIGLIAGLVLLVIGYLYA
ncbi:MULTISPECIES: mercuric transporter MerT family protein [Acidocella]|uniref:Mercuric transport protein MerT n=1 Tax=Acidocella aminolytica 101 = DSM 11237 TaxID=1120923 RepID=A0A0D6PLG9_9PROT|nr:MULTISPECIES: mercuric transporter MerT family protein [Acidocella]MBU6426136.1 mercuric reductase [Rhodospirillales bacterium]GAN82206.1 mercuric ion transporter MerT [Acidocella aminolytica 101 = DSM 11237]SHF22027.1 mercuric ion transport protein [Acidocella aminolytica 101 = DSM 11237]